MEKIEFVKPSEIEKRSFEIITEELNGRVFEEKTGLVIKRVIHTTADFDYADSLVFSDRAVELGISALKEGRPIITDTNMGKAGINKTALSKYHNQVHCFMADGDVAEYATSHGETRAAASMEKAAGLKLDGIFAVGNAPTALIKLHQLIQKGEIHPRLIIGVPVGFVNVTASKELILSLDTPYIVARGRKGGSNVAAAICNALLYQL